MLTKLVQDNQIGQLDGLVKLHTSRFNHSTILLLKEFQKLQLSSFVNHNSPIGVSDLRSILRLFDSQYVHKTPLFASVPIWGSCVMCLGTLFCIALAAV
jgi:hypothetical protein